MVHGLNDENVKTRQFGAWWNELTRYNVPRRLFLHQGEHIEPYYAFGATYSTPLLQWFDHYLQGIDNGAPTEPQAIIQRENLSWSTDAVWPPAGTTEQTLTLSSPLGRSAGALTTLSAPAGKTTRYLKLKQSTAYSTDTIVANPTQQRADRLVFLSDALVAPVRLSGTAKITLRVQVDQPTAGFQVRLVDYSGNTAYIVSRTIADLGHHKSWEVQRDLVPGQWYTLTWEINTDDRIFAAGRNLGVVINAEKANPLIGYLPVKAKVDTAKSSITLPLSGNLAGLTTAGALAPMVTTTLGPRGPATDVSEFVREFFEGTQPR